MLNPELIIYNGRIYPDGSPSVHFEALAVWKGKVTDLGPDNRILNLRTHQTKTVNLHGRVVLPGFCDSHIHLLSYGTLLQTLDLSRTRSIEDMKKLVSNASRQKRKNQWVLGRGWDDEKLLEHRYPDKHDLDQVTSNPVFLKRVCGHVAVANSKALLLAHVDSDTPDPDGGVIVKDSKGKPNGVLREHAIELVEKEVPLLVDETRRALVLASRKLAKLGITSLHCIVSDLNELVELRRLKRNGEILQSIYAVVPLRLLDQLLDLGITTERNGDGFRIGGLKLFLDGSLGARTAALNTAYNDDPGSRGMLTMNHRNLERLARKATEAGFQLCIHAIGDRAVELALDVLRSIGSRNCRRLRHRIEHASVATEDSILKMKRLGIIASVQPRFIYSDSWAKERLGLVRVQYLYPFASLNRAGIVTAAGSDCPVEDPNPFEGVWSAVARPGLDQSEALTVSQAIASYSRNAAYASFCEEDRGSLTPGKVADMIVVDRDPFAVGTNALRKTRVVETVIDGRLVS